MLASALGSAYRYLYKSSQKSLLAARVMRSFEWNLLARDDSQVIVWSIK